jgi:hypothetical protein
MAHSPAAMIAARMNHAPQLAPAKKSPIALPLYLLRSQNITLVQKSARLRISSVESVTSGPSQKLQQTKSLALTHLAIDGCAG